MSSTRLGSALIAVVLLCAMTATLPDMIRIGRRTAALARLSYEQRRAHLLGPLYPSIRAIDSAVPRHEPIAIVLRQPADADLGIYVNFYLYPRRTRVYFGLPAYLRDRERPRHVAAIDRAEAWDVRLMTETQIVREWESR